MGVRINQIFLQILFSNCILSNYEYIVSTSDSSDMEMAEFRKCSTS
jgi:hypothetical protein